MIEDCSFDTGDDCIAVNSGRNADGRRLADALAQHPGPQLPHAGRPRRRGGGQRDLGGARWVFAENCHMDSPNLWSPIRFKNNALRVVFSRISTIATSTSAKWVARQSPATSTTKRREQRVHRNCATCSSSISMSGKAIRVLDSQGLPNAPVNDLTLCDCSFSGVTQPSIVEYTRSVKLEKVRVNEKLVTEL